MKKIAITIPILLFVVFIWYNFNRGLTFEVRGQEEPLSEQEEAELFGEEFRFCNTEIPIGEAIEEGVHFACQLSRALNDIQQASLAYRQTVKEIADLAKSCNLDSCMPVCTSDTELICVDVPKEVCGACGEPCPTEKDCKEPPKSCQRQIIVDGDVFFVQDVKYCWEETEKICDSVAVCRTRPCSGDPCPARQLIEDKFNYLANLSRTIEREKSTIYYLLNVRRPEIQEKLDEARRLLEFNAPTPEQYQFAWFTPCETAVVKGWVELETLQEGQVCKSPYNYLVCR